MGVFGVKVGLLLSYYRAFITTRFRVAAATLGMITICVFLTNLFSIMVQCTPTKGFRLNIGRDCFDQNAFYTTSWVLNVVSDVAVLILPLPVIWGLQTSTSRKISLSVLFLLGAL